MVPQLTLPNKTIDYRFVRGQGLTLLRVKAHFFFATIVHLIQLPSKKNGAATRN